MARGWESKSIEAQIESAEAARAPRGPVKTAQQIEQERERQSLELIQARLTQDLAAATHPRRQEQLRAAMRHIEAKIAALGN